MNIRISCITPSIRPDMLSIVAKCLKRQTFTDWEWIIAAPAKLQIPIDKQIGRDFYYEFVSDPPKKEGEFYKLNAGWNKSLRCAKGELFVSIVDGLWFPPDTLRKLWDHYQRDPKAIISGIGHQYTRLENGKPEGLAWIDPRINFNEKSFFETEPNHIELCLASIPMKAVHDVKGFKEEFDKYAALSEKEMCIRMSKFGYKFYIDKYCEYRALKHERLSPLWDQKYFEGCKYFEECVKNINRGEELTGDL